MSRWNLVSKITVVFHYIATEEIKILENRNIFESGGLFKDFFFYPTQMHL